MEPPTGTTYGRKPCASRRRAFGKLLERLGEGFAQDNVALKQIQQQTVAVGQVVTVVGTDRVLQQRDAMQPQLAQLVAAQAQRGKIIALDENIPRKKTRQPGEMLERRRRADNIQPRKSGHPLGKIAHGSIAPA